MPYAHAVAVLLGVLVRVNVRVGVIVRVGVRVGVLVQGTGLQGVAVAVGMGTVKVPIRDQCWLGCIQVARIDPDPVPL